MSTPQDSPGAHNATCPGVLVCPVCRQPTLQRLPRTPWDRMKALFASPTAPLRRYACDADGCGWQGLLRGNQPHRPGYQPQHWLEP